MEIKEIGGYIELELPNLQEYHKDAIRLNSARSCLKYILEERKCKKLYIPYYICDSVIEAIISSGTSFEYYFINKDLMPKNKIQQKENEFILYVNYFGICEDNIELLEEEYNNLIIDNTQGFFYKKINKNIDYIYSARKFFGVPDGGYLISNLENKVVEQDVSYNKVEHLVKRIDEGAANAYQSFKVNEERFEKLEVLSMSKLTKRILKSIDYDKVITQRNANFNTLHSVLKRYNKLEKINLENINGPMVYPFLIDNKNIKSHLIQNKIYIPTYWGEVLEKVDNKTFEHYITNNLIPIPIDQRYSEEDMLYIIKIIEEVL